MSIQLKVTLFISFLLTFTIGNAFLILYLETIETEKVGLVNHTHEVLMESENLLGDMQDAETGQRGFLLTRNSFYLEPYNAVFIHEKEHFLKLQTLVSDNTDQLKRLQVVKKLIELKFHELDNTIKLAQNNNYQKAMELVKQDLGKQYMDDIRTNIKDFNNIETKLLEKRKDDFEQQRIIINSLIVLEIIFFIVMSLIAFVFLKINLFIPLKLLLSNTKKMERGEMINILDTGRNDVIGSLLTSFIKMNETVNSRTKELQGFKEMLEIKVKDEVEKNRKKDQQLIQQSRLAQMGEMISMIAHQWRQPLSSISAIAGTLSMDVMMDEYKKEFFQERLESIDEISQHLSSTINDFRDFYKPDKKKEIVKLEEVIRKSLSIIRTSLLNDNTEIIEEYNSKEEIELYNNELMHVILNILKNAQDKLQEMQIQDPYIKITTEDETISICDNGGGIPEDIMKKIFDPSFSTKSEKNGTGLGLYMSKTIVEEHLNGKLSAENTDDGVCFTIELGIISEK